MNEHGFIKSVHRHLPTDIFSWKIHDTFTGGVPDAMYAGPAGILFVEYKYTKLPKKPTPINNNKEEDERRIQQKSLSLFPIIPSMGFTIYF